jgi:hypothetical protein
MANQRFNPTRRLVGYPEKRTARGLSADAFDRIKAGAVTVVLAYAIVYAAATFGGPHVNHSALD